MFQLIHLAIIGEYARKVVAVAQKTYNNECVCVWCHSYTISDMAICIQKPEISTGCQYCRFSAVQVNKFKSMILHIFTALNVNTVVF
jgi:hypothetical protein